MAKTLNYVISLISIKQTTFYGDFMDTQETEKYTQYHNFLSNFICNSVTITSYNVNCIGDDFDGFEAEIIGILSNGVNFYFEHDIDGVGTFRICTHKETLIREIKFDLSKIGSGYGFVLNDFLIKTLNFDF